MKFALNVNGVTFRKIAGRGALMTPLLSKALQVCGPRTLLEANLPMSEKRGHDKKDEGVPENATLAKKKFTLKDLCAISWHRKYEDQNTRSGSKLRFKHGRSPRRGTGVVKSCNEEWQDSNYRSSFHKEINTSILNSSNEYSPLNKF